LDWLADHSKGVFMALPIASTSPSFAARGPVIEPGAKNESYGSGVSWAAVIAGASVTAALFLILLALGAGVGLSAISPWSNVGASASRIGAGAIIWLIFVEIAASAMGGYLAGRLRTKWVDLHTDEVYFRDTAHGFLVWAVGIVITFAFLASAATSMVGGAAGEPGATAKDPNEYFVDALLRSNPPNPERNDAAVRAEVGRVFARTLTQGEAAAEDRTYLTQVVAARTGISQTEAARRVPEVETRARQAADTARKVVAHSLFWMFIALLIGAFCASYAATIGGRQRDHVIA
jgi:hypothetical protein